MLPPVKCIDEDGEISPKHSTLRETKPIRRKYKMDIEIKPKLNQRILSNNQRHLSNLRMRKNMSVEYRHLPDPDYHPPKGDDLYVCVDADVSKPLDPSYRSQFPKIKKSRFSNALETLSIDERRKKNNKSLVRMRKNLKLPNHLSNYSILSNNNTQIRSNIEISRERENKSVTHLINKLKKAQMVKAGTGSELSNFTPGRNIHSKKTLPMESRINMMIKNDSTVDFPQSLISKRSYDKTVIFSDIEVYLNKIRKHGKIQPKIYGIFKLPIGKIHEPQGDFEASSVSSILSQ